MFDVVASTNKSQLAESRNNFDFNSYKRLSGIFAITHDVAGVFSEDASLCIFMTLNSLHNTPLNDSIPYHRYMREEVKEQNLQLKISKQVSL